MRDAIPTLLILAIFPVAWGLDTLIDRFLPEPRRRPSWEIQRMDERARKLGYEVGEDGRYVKAKPPYDWAADNVVYLDREES